MDVRVQIDEALEALAIVFPSFDTLPVDVQRALFAMRFEMGPPNLDGYCFESGFDAYVNFVSYVNSGNWGRAAMELAGRQAGRFSRYAKVFRAAAQSSPRRFPNG